ncbi:MAG: hypothetical protein HC821_00710 [Lewinella sp.]|nr:hypothetical protein [Lewinella sp.]
MRGRTGWRLPLKASQGRRWAARCLLALALIGLGADFWPTTGPLLLNTKAKFSSQ